MGYMTDERNLIQDTAREFTSNEVLPVANELDPEKGLIPRELIDKMGAMGYFGITIPEEKGGLGLGAFEYCLVAEELARGWMSVASIIARGNGFWRSVPGYGAEQDEKIAKMAHMVRTFFASHAISCVVNVLVQDLIVAVSVTLIISYSLNKLSALLVA